jgi:hypothetical protein
MSSPLRLHVSLTLHDNFSTVRYDSIMRGWVGRTHAEETHHITLGEQVSDALRRSVWPRGQQPFHGRPGTSQLLERDLEAGYREVALDEARETEALEWAEATVGDVAILSPQ